MSYEIDIYSVMHSNVYRLIKIFPGNTVFGVKHESLDAAKAAIDTLYEKMEKSIAKVEKPTDMQI